MLVDQAKLAQFAENGKAKTITFQKNPSTKIATTYTQMKDSLQQTITQTHHKNIPLIPLSVVLGKARAKYVIHWYCYTLVDGTKELKR